MWIYNIPWVVNSNLCANQSTLNLTQALDRGLENYNMQAKSGHLPAFVNKVLLEHIKVIHCWVVYDSFHTAMSELSSFERYCKGHKTIKIFTN